MSYASMFDENDLKYIISDLEDVLEHHKKSEEYEVCAPLEKLILNFGSYLDENIDYSDIMHPLFDVCLARYEIHRLHEYNGERFVIFLLPNYGKVYFHVDNVVTNSDLWQKIKKEFDNSNKEIEENIIILLDEQNRTNTNTGI